MKWKALAEPKFEALYELLSRSRDRVLRKRLNEVIRLTRDRHVESAYHLVKRSISVSPSDVMAQYLAGRLARAYGDVILAKSHFTQAIYASCFQGPEATNSRKELKGVQHRTRVLVRWSLISLINLLIQCNQRDELHALLKWRLTVDEHIELYFVLGWLEESSGRFKQAKESYKNALSLDSDAHESRVSLSRVLIHTNELDQAQTHLNQLRRELPKSELVWTLQGHLKLIQGETVDGIRALKKAVRHNSNCSLAYRLLGDHFAEQNPRRSVSYYLHAQRGDTPTYDLYQKLATVYQRLERYDDAVSQLSLLRYFVPAEQQASIQRWIRMLQEAQEDQEQRGQGRIFKSMGQMSEILSRWFQRP